MVTVLDKELKRQVTVDGADYTLSVHRDGFRLTGKGKRKPEVELLWRDLLSGDAAMAVALNASLGIRSSASATSLADKPTAAGKRAAKKPAGNSTSS